MPTYGKKLLDNNGNTILPKTRSNLVYHGSTLLSTKLNSIDTEITNIKNGTTTVAKATALTTNAGDSNTPVYFSNGKPVSTGKSFANYVPKSGTTMTGNLTAYGTNRANSSLRNISIKDSSGNTMQSTNSVVFTRL